MHYTRIINGEFDVVAAADRENWEIQLSGLRRGEIADKGNNHSSQRRH